MSHFAIKGPLYKAVVPNRYFFINQNDEKKVKIKQIKFLSQSKTVTADLVVSTKNKNKTLNMLKIQTCPI